MRMLNHAARVLAIVVCCALATAAIGQSRSTTGKANSKPAARKLAVHPEIDPAQECNSCHEAEYKQWNESRHATGGVLCIVCHGSVTENFMRQPATVRCEGCHAAQVETLKVSASARKMGNACFACHAPHTLKVKKQRTKSPHASVEIGGMQ